MIIYISPYLLTFYELTSSLGIRPWRKGGEGSIFGSTFFLPPFGPPRLLSRTLEPSSLFGLSSAFPRSMYNYTCLSLRTSFSFNFRLPALHCICEPLLGCHHDQIAASLTEYT